MPKGLYQRESLVGRKFHELEVIESAGTKQEHRMWKCRCSCGKIKEISTTKLHSGEYKSCGHLKSGYAWRGTGDISLTYWGQIVRNAEIRDIDFKLTIQEAWDLFLKQGRKCAYTELPLTFSIKKAAEQTASLDRINSDLDYTLNNVHWVHKDVNNMKQSFSHDYFVKLCKLIGAKNWDG